MTRLNALLLIGVLFSAFYLVRTQYDSRRLYTEYDRARSESRRLDLERERLEVERRAQGTSLRVEHVAKEQLHMKNVTPAITQYILEPVGAQDVAKAAPANAAPNFLSLYLSAPLKTQVAGTPALKNASSSSSSSRVDMP